MNSNIKLTIIIPAYNVEEYIGDALDSLQNQTEPPDQIVVINDGSCDHTINIIESFNFSCALDVVSVENNGQGPARNLGVSLSTGDYIYFFDSDDILDLNFVKKIKKRIKESSFPDIVLFSGKSFYDDAYEGNRRVSYSRGFEGYFTSPADFIKKGYEKNGLSCSPCLYVSKRELWGDGRLEFATNYLEDDALFYPLIFSCESIDVMDECFFYRRIRPGSAMTIVTSKKHVDGALNCLVKAIDLYHKVDNQSKIGKKYIKKRIESFSTTYVRYCRVVDSKIDTEIVTRSLLITKSPKHLAKVFIYYTGLNNSNLIMGSLKLVKRKLTWN